MKQYLGIDVGGTAIKYGYVDENGKVLTNNKVKTPKTKGEFLEQLIQIINQSQDIQGVGISMPGFVDSDTGFLKTAGALIYLEQTNLIQELEKEISLPIHVENDAKCAAISEMWNGNAVDLKTFVCLTVGTGIGGAVIVNKKLHKGPNYSAGEFGFMITDNNTGKILSENSGLYFQRKNYAKKNNLKLEQVTGEEALADKEIQDQFYKHLATAIFNLIYILNPEKILLGGQISNDEKFIQRLKKEVEELDVNPNIEYQITKCLNTNNAGLIGAVYELKNKLASN